MANYIFKTKFFITAILIALICFILQPEIANARGGSFGGRSSFGGGRSSSSGRSSFGGSRSSSGGSNYSTRSGSSPSSSFGGARNSGTFGSSAKASSMPSSFHNARQLSSAQEYTGRYGVPRKTFAAGSTPGIPSNYVVHDYGGYGNGLMMGYMLGHSSWMWYMPFHPAFYYSQPYYMENPDGTVEVYPPTFSMGKLIFTLLIFGAIVYIIYVIIRNRRQGGWTEYSSPHSQSSFS